MLCASFLLLPSILDGRKEQHISIKLNARKKGVSFMPIEKLPEAKLALYAQVQMLPLSCSVDICYDYGEDIVLGGFV